MLKNKKILWCNHQGISFKKGRLVFNNLDHLPNKTEMTKKPQHAPESSEEVADRQSLENAGWLVKHLSTTDFGSDDRNNRAKKQAEDQRNDLLQAEAVNQNTSKEKRRSIFNNLNIRNAQSRNMIESFRTNEMVKEQEELQSLHERALGKIKAAETHFRSNAVKNKNQDSFYKVISDFIVPWWNSELTDHERKILSAETNYSYLITSDKTPVSMQPINPDRPVRYHGKVSFGNGIPQIEVWKVY